MNIKDRKNKDIWFLHLPKTGGASIKIWAQNNKIRMYSSGHEFFSKDIVSELNNNVKLMTVLRCPVENTRSMYSYLKENREKTPSYKMKSFSEWLRTPDEEWGYRWHKLITTNLYVLFYSEKFTLREAKNMPDDTGFELDENDYSAALENLKSVDYVFDTANLTSQLNNTLIKELKTKNFNVNMNTSKKFKVSDSDVEFIYENRKMDFELCKEFNILSDYAK